MILIGEAVQWDGTPANIKLKPYFNLFPKIQIFVDVPSTIESENTITKIYSKMYDVTDCTTDIKIKTVFKNSCGQLTCKFIHEDCQEKFIVGSRIRLYLDDRCWFCGIIFTRDFSSKNSMSIIAFDFLRYFKAPLTYGKNQLMTIDGQLGLVASDIFTKICQDLAIPFDVVETSSIPITPQNYSQKTAFNILEFAILQTLVNSPSANRQYFTYYHESNFEEDYEKNMSETQVFKTGGKVLWRLRNNLKVDTVIDDDMIYDYKFRESIDQQTYNEIIVYKDQKTYLSSTGKTLKKGKKTGTQIKRVAKDNKSKALYGYLPYYHKAPDGYSEAQMQQVADELKNILSRPTHDLSVECYGIIGMKAGYLVPVALTEIGGSHIGNKKTDEDTGEEYLEPVYRTVTECEISVEYPLRMSLKLSSGMFGEVDL